jgi:hypothetical protein
MDASAGNQISPGAGTVIPAPARRPIGHPPIPCLTEYPLPLDVEALDLEVRMTLNDGRYVVVAPSEEITGLLYPFSSRARTVLIALLNGCSLRMGATRAGISVETVRMWGQRHPEWADAQAKASDWGFSATFESELHHVAMDRTHRGQIRALELVAKSRAPEYREKNQLEISVITAAQTAVAKLGSGWDEEANQTRTQP